MSGYSEKIIVTLAMLYTILSAAAFVTAVTAGMHTAFWILEAISFGLLALAGVVARYCYREADDDVAAKLDA